MGVQAPQGAPHKKDRQVFFHIMIRNSTRKSVTVVRQSVTDFSSIHPVPDYIVFQKCKIRWGSGGDRLCMIFAHLWILHNSTFWGTPQADMNTSSEWILNIFLHPVNCLRQLK